MSTFPRWLEEVLPFAAYLHLEKNKAQEMDDIAHDRAIAPRIQALRDSYRKLGLDELDACLSAEHDRTESLVDKTFKFGAVLASALVIASAATTLIAENLSGTTWKILILMSTLPAVIYIAFAGMLGLSAIRAQPRFGWGATALLDRKGKSDDALVTLLAKELVLQEQANIINVACNEAAYMSLRNGFLLVLISLTVALIGVTVQ